jgi:hypothetical protein
MLPKKRKKRACFFDYSQEQIQRRSTQRTQSEKKRRERNLAKIFLGEDGTPLRKLVPGPWAHFHIRILDEFLCVPLRSLRLCVEIVDQHQR